MAKTKLRKMLGSAEHPTVVKLMRTIETQSLKTISEWAVDYAENYYLPVLKNGCELTEEYISALGSVRKYLAGEITKKDAKPFLKVLTDFARGVSDPVCQAAARAVSVAFGVFQTPTNSLGFTFYGAAVYAYSTAGLEESQEVYDRLADEEFERILSSLMAVYVENEPDPVKVNWNC